MNLRQTIIVGGLSSVGVATPTRFRNAMLRAACFTLAASLIACGSGSGQQEPSEDDFEFTEDELATAAVGTYDGTLETADGATGLMSLSVERAPAASSTAGGLELRPQCGTISRGGAALETAALQPQCGTTYTTILPLSGTATSDAFDTAISGALEVDGLTLDEGDWSWSWSLVLDDGSELQGYGRNGFEGEWRTGDWRSGFEILGTFSVGKKP